MGKYNLKDYADLARQAAAEGVVLIKNADSVLPLKGNEKIALFGRTQFNYYKSGTGSGGLVNTRYVKGIYEAIKEDSDFQLNEDLRHTYEEWVKDHPFDKGIGWASEPWFQAEMPVTKELVKKAANDSEVAVVIIGRTAGEDKDSKAEAGSYLLTDSEKEMLENVCGTFDKTVVILNVGNIIDMKWMDEYDPSAVLYAWQGGQEGGLGVLDVLNGTVSPSGKLTDTIALNIEDYFTTKYHGGKESNIYAEDIYVGYRYFETFGNKNVLYPFGYGLSYTTFSKKTVKFVKNGSDFEIDVEVENTGKAAGKEAVLIYVSAPQGKLGKASKVLVGFKKTKCLTPGEKEILHIDVKDYYYASYDDSGATGHKSSYVLEEGKYEVYVGCEVDSASKEAEFELKDIQVLETLSEAMGPVVDFDVLKPGEKTGDVYVESFVPASKRTVNPMDRRKENIPAEIPMTGDK
ncbi:MAG: glycoside hydrolase family 3 C-terminal domain-containing protein, partial [Lachnospiraceae bacterium]|nr:glycoside hydrolase family 3 C-terminal domain-containing protein [Lachnospiraceae bacterium]